MNNKPIMHETPFELLARHYAIRALSNMNPEAANTLDENPSFHGFILVYNGPTIIERAAEMVTRPKQGFREKATLYDRRAFTDYFDHEERHGNGDWVYFFNTANGEIIKYKGELKTNHTDVDLEQVLEDNLPDDFMSHHGATKYDVGTRTGTTVGLPKAYPGINIIILKETSWGKLAHFDEQGLIEEFYLWPEAEGTGPFIDAINGIKAIYKCYRNKDGEPNRDENGKLVPSRQGAVDIYLEDSKGTRLGPYRKPDSRRQYPEKEIHAAPLAVSP